MCYGQTVRAAAAVRYQWREEPSWCKVSNLLEQGSVSCWQITHRHKVTSPVAGIHYRWFDARSAFLGHTCIILSVPLSSFMHSSSLLSSPVHSGSFVSYFYHLGHHVSYYQFFRSIHLSSPIAMYVSHIFSDKYAADFYISASCK